MSRSATQRTLKYFRERGYLAEVVERWNPFAGPRVNGKPVGQRKDLFGFIDILAVHPDRPGMTCIQSTAGTSNLQARVRKILEIDVAATVLQAGNKIYVFGWRQLKATGWTPKIVEVTLEGV